MIGLQPRLEPKPDVHDVVVAPFSIRMLGGVVVGLGLALIGGSVVIGFDALLITGAAIGSAAGLVVTLARVSMRVADGVVTVWFVPILRIRVPLTDVREVSIEEIDPRRTGGVGVARYRGCRVLCVSAGRGVRFSSKFGTVLVQCEDPITVADALSS